MTAQQSAARRNRNNGVRRYFTVLCAQSTHKTRNLDDDNNVETTGGGLGAQYSVFCDVIVESRSCQRLLDLAVR